MRPNRALWVWMIAAMLGACAPKDPGPSSPDAQSIEPAATAAPESDDAAAITAPEPSTAAPEPPAAHFVERSFVPLSRVTETWGALQFGNRRAQFAAFDGEMQLEHAGVMPDAAGAELAGAQVYRVINAEEYFSRNAGRNAFCSEAPRWLAVRAVTTEARPGDEFWVALMTSEDWSSYRPELAGYCGGGLYAPARQPTPMPTSAGMQVRCGEESFRLRFESENAHVELADGSSLTLPRLNTDADPEAPRQYTNGRLTFIHETEGTSGRRVLFARGRMVPQPCAIAQN